MARRGTGRGTATALAARWGDLRRPFDEVEPRVLLENVPLEALERPAGVDPELVDERSTCLLIDLERLRLAPAAVEREHQLRAKPLMESVRHAELLELTDELAVAPAGEVGFDPLLERRKPQLLEPRRRHQGERLEQEVGECGATPECKRLSQQCRCRLRSAVGE